MSLFKKNGNYAQHNVKPKSNIFYEETKNISEIVNINVLIVGIRIIETMEEVLNKNIIQYFLELEDH